MTNLQEETGNDLIPSNDYGESVIRGDFTEITLRTLPPQGKRHLPINIIACFPNNSSIEEQKEIDSTIVKIIFGI